MTEYKVPGPFNFRSDGKEKNGPDTRFRTSEPFVVVPQEGIEPPTGGLEGRCSIP